MHAIVMVHKMQRLALSASPSPSTNKSSVPSAGAKPAVKPADNAGNVITPQDSRHAQGAEKEPTGDW